MFAEPWQAQAFAMAVALQERGVITAGDWAAALGAEIAARPEQPYYDSWLAALEALSERKGLISPTERAQRIASWAHAARMTPHGQPIELNAAGRMK